MRVIIKGFTNHNINKLFLNLLTYTFSAYITKTKCFVDTL